MPFINKPDSSRDLTIFISSFISSSEIINDITPDSHIFLWIAAFIDNAAAVNPNVIKMLLANGLSTFCIKGSPVFSNDPKRLPKNPPDGPILFKWVFNNFTLAEKLFPKALTSFETCVFIITYAENYSHH